MAEDEDDDLPLELPEAIHAQILELSANGDQLMEEGRFEDAAHAFEEAWSLLPEPRMEWEAATWLLAGLGDAAFFQGDFAAVRAAMEQAVFCPGGLGNPFLHLRLGQALYEQGQLDRAADELMRAYMGDGAAVFEGADPKYLAFLRSRVALD